METMIRNNLLARERNTHATLTRGIGWGLLGGLAGTLLMDLFLMGGLFLAGLPIFTCFSIVGDTAARFFTLLGIEMEGSVAAGVVTHYIIGPAIGALFGAIVVRASTLRVNTLKKCIVLAVLYIEILSQPLLAGSVLLLEMKWPMTGMWYGGAFVMHFILGIILGETVSRGLRLGTLASHK